MSCRIGARLQDRVMIYRRNALRRAHIQRDRVLRNRRYEAMPPALRRAFEASPARIR